MKNKNFIIAYLSLLTIALTIIIKESITKDYFIELITDPLVIWICIIPIIFNYTFGIKYLITGK